jgi:hypothetical protein
LYHDGVEIIGHTITTGNDNNDVVISGLKLLSQYGARNWIDHGTNFEDLAHKGSLAGDPYYIVGLLTNAGYQYVWTYLDYTYAINIINPSRSGFIDSYFYYNRNLDNDVTDNKRLYLWSSNEIQNQPDLWYAGANIDALIAQRGIHIGHAYYANPAEENHAWWVNQATGKIEIFPAFETALEYMTAKRTAGLLWTPTMSEAGDFWELLPDVLVKRISDNEYMVTNNNSVPVNRLTLLAENDIKSAKVNGTVINTYAGAYGSREVVISSIAPGESIKVTIGY